MKTLITLLLLSFTVNMLGAAGIVVTPNGNSATLQRTAVGSGHVSVSDGDGVSGNPTITLSDVTTLTAGWYTNVIFYVDQKGIMTNAINGIIATNGISGTNGLDGSTAPTIITNSIWIGAGAWAPGGGALTDGGRNGATASTMTNGTAGQVQDVYLFDASTNNIICYSFNPGRNFAGQLKAQFSWLTTNALNGASNVVWEIAVGAMMTNNLFGTYSYVTNTTDRFWSSNSCQSTALPLVTVTNLSPNMLLNLRASCLGTNTADEAIGNRRFLGATLFFTSTNYPAGFP